MKWICVEELSEKLHISKQCVRWHCREGHFEALKTKAGYSVNIESVMNYYHHNPAIVAQFGARTKLSNQENGTYIPSQKALARATLLGIYEQTVNKAKHILTAKKSFVQSYQKDYPNLFSALKVTNYRTLDQWLKKYREHNNNLEYLEDNYCGKKAVISDEEKDAIIKFLLHPSQLPYAQVIRGAKSLLAQKQIASKSDSTYYRIIRNYRRYNYDAYTFARDGIKALNDKVVFYLQRDLERIEFGDIWIADGHTFNFTLPHPQTGQSMRMTLILFYDMKTRMPLGYEIMASENVAAISSALRRSILLSGKMLGVEAFLPKVIILDNGKAFRAKYFRGTKDFGQEPINGIFKQLGIEPVYAIVRNAKAKPIERFFGTLHEFERRMPTYCGSDIEHKPAYLRAGESYHKQLQQNISIENFTLQSVAIKLAQYFDEYCKRPIQGKKSPYEAAEESIMRLKKREDISTRIVSKNVLELLMMEERELTLTRNGVRINGTYYWNEKLYGIEVGTKVTVRYDGLYDIDYALVNVNGEWIRAERFEKTHPAAKQLGDSEDVETLKNYLKMRKHLVKQTIQEVKMVHAKYENQKEESDGKLPWTQEPLRLVAKKKSSGSDSNELLHDYAEMLEEEAKASKEKEEPIFLFEYEREEYLRQQASNK